MPVNAICPSHFGQRGHSITVRLSKSVNSAGDMMLPWRGREREKLQDSDALIRTVVVSKMHPSTPESLSNIDQFSK
jgi:hypothetical protein